MAISVKIVKMTEMETFTPSVWTFCVSLEPRHYASLRGHPRTCPEMYHTPVCALGGVGSNARRAGYYFAILSQISPKMTNSQVNIHHTRLALLPTPPKVYTGV